jgi:hypothetical protein
VKVQSELLSGQCSQNCYPDNDALRCVAEHTQVKREMITKCICRERPLVLYKRDG